MALISAKVNFRVFLRFFWWCSGGGTERSLWLRLTGCCLFVFITLLESAYFCHIPLTRAWNHLRERLFKPNITILIRTYDSFLYSLIYSKIIEIPNCGRSFITRPPYISNCMEWMQQIWICFFFNLTH